MNEIEYDLGTGFAHEAEQALAETTHPDTLWLDFDGDAALWDCEPFPLPDCDPPLDAVVTGVGRAALDLFPDIPLGVDHRSVLAQEPVSPVSEPPWLAGR
ncbi:hypothetical protein [Nocardia sp. SSK8]|uniref:hypothetical protein n=1 Tax=Nocardia sp. SSK8 TaxID=3120154 RepID=UPI003008CFF7